MVCVVVTDQNKLDGMMKFFKKVVQKEGILKEAKARKEYVKPSTKKREEAKERKAKFKKRKN